MEEPYISYNELVSARYSPTSTMIIEPSRSWMRKFQALQLFLQENGWDNLRENKSLYSWASTLRGEFHKGGLGAIEFAKLQKIGFIWDPVMYKWDRDYILLKEHYESNSGKEPLYDSNNPETIASKLGSFVQQARRDHGSKSLSDYKFRKLSLLKDFSFEGRDKTWSRNSDRVKKKIEEGNFKSLHSHLGSKDYAWLILQRNKLKGSAAGNLTMAQKDWLVALDLDRFFVPWEQTCLAVEYFKAQHGKLPTSNSNKDLFVWLQSQRQTFIKGNLLPEQISKLESLGLDLSGKVRKQENDAQWKIHYNNYVAFTEKYGVDPTARTDSKLYNWVHANRQVYKETAKNRQPLESWKIELLVKIGFAFTREEILRKRWDWYFKDFCTYLNEAGIHYFSDDPKARVLYTWFSKQKKRYEQGTLSIEHQIQFEKAGIDLNVAGVLRSLANFRPVTLVSKSDYINKLQQLTISDLETRSGRRLEHDLQKLILFEHKKEIECAICGNMLPPKLMVVAHIKKRSKCSLEERKNYNVVMPACSFGCDVLYEKGFIAVVDGRVIPLYINLDNLFLTSYIEKLNGRKCSFYNRSTEGFFAFHLNYHRGRLYLLISFRL